MYCIILYFFLLGMFHTTVLHKTSILIDLPEKRIVINPYWNHALTRSVCEEKDHDVSIIYTQEHPDATTWFDFCQSKEIPYYDCSKDQENSVSAVIEEASLQFFMYFWSHKFLRFVYQNTVIVYNHAPFDSEDFVSLVSSCDLLLFAFDQETEKQQDLLSQGLRVSQEIQPRVVVPLWLSSSDAIEFCRQLMLQRCCVPKFLHSGQSVVHAV